ncbi:MAG: hypothetical protein ABI771_08150 [Betaproteobacteria bacterium]
MDEKNTMKESQWLEQITRAKHRDGDAPRSMDAPENRVPIVAYYHNKKRQFSNSADLIEWLSEEEQRI